MKTKFDLLVVLLLLCCCLGCEPKPTQPVTMHEGYNNSPRFTVTRIAVIEDNLAYSNRRGLYQIIDTETGKEYIGLSGVGISELGSHSVHVGKTTTQSPDER